MDEWISFKEKLPEKGVHVLVSTYGVTTIGWRDSEITENLRLTIIDPINYQVITGVDMYRYSITHWMPLPQHRYTGR